MYVCCMQGTNEEQLCYATFLPKKRNGNINNIIKYICYAQASIVLQVLHNIVTQRAMQSYSQALQRILQCTVFCALPDM